MSDKLKNIQSHLSNPENSETQDLSSAGYPELTLLSNILDQEVHYSLEQPIVPYSDVLGEDKSLNAKEFSNRKSEKSGSSPSVRDAGNQS